MEKMSSSGSRSQVPHSRPHRLVNLGISLARVYGGYRLIGLREKQKGEAWARQARHEHHVESASLLYDTAARDQGLLIKTLQFLSSRPDVVPDEYIAVLSHLQDEVPPEPFAVVRRVVEQELG